jgi:hypothetical protein
LPVFAAIFFKAAEILRVLGQISSSSYQMGFVEGFQIATKPRIP